MEKNRNENKARMSMYIAQELKDYIDSQAKYYGIGQSAYISMLVADRMRQDSTMKQLPEFMERLKQLTDMVEVVDGDKEYYK